MQVRGLVILAGLVCLALSCGGSGGEVTAPTTPGESILSGVGYLATVDEVEHTQSTVKQLTLRVQLRNTTDESMSRAYPAGCPVRIRLYRPIDQALVYDESQFDCAVDNHTSFVIAPQQTVSLTSGTRNPWDVAGDSLATPATYYAAALVRIVGQNPIELDAGTYRLPFCKDSFPANGLPFKHCAY